MKPTELGLQKYGLSVLALLYLTMEKCSVCNNNLLTVEKKGSVIEEQDEYLKWKSCRSSLSFCIWFFFSLKTETEFGCLGRETGCRWPGEMGLLVKG